MKPTKIQSVDHTWIAFNESIPSTPASSAFNLKPAGFPINQTHPERKKVANQWIKFKPDKQIDSSWYNSDQPTKFPRRISTTKDDHIECLCIAAFSAYSTHDCDLAHKRIVLNIEKYAINIKSYRWLTIVMIEQQRKTKPFHSRA
jgi:hypothetical protein